MKTIYFVSCRNGFNTVFPLDKLSSFSPSEVKTIVCGDQCPEFTKEDLMRYSFASFLQKNTNFNTNSFSQCYRYTEPKLGYTRESPAFLRFVNVLIGFTAAERKAFLQFTTGCSSLPPGNFTNFSLPWFDDKISFFSKVALPTSSPASRSSAKSRLATARTRPSIHACTTSSCRTTRQRRS